MANLSHERIKRRPVLGGLINEYERAAWSRCSAAVADFWNPTCGTVVIHYAPHEPVALRLYQSNTGEPVFLVRPDGQPHEQYSQPYGNILGYGYAAPWQQPGSWMIWDHYCTSHKETCLGWSTNHYQSRDNKVQHARWEGPQEAVRFIAPAGPDQCAAGQVPMYRFANFKGRDRDYIVGTSAPANYTDYSEFLGCLWSP